MDMADNSIRPESSVEVKAPSPSASPTIKPTQELRAPSEIALLGGSPSSLPEDLPKPIVSPPMRKKSIPAPRKNNAKSTGRTSETVVRATQNEFLATQRIQADSSASAAKAVLGTGSSTTASVTGASNTGASNTGTSTTAADTNPVEADPKARELFLYTAGSAAQKEEEEAEAAAIKEVNLPTNKPLKDAGKIRELPSGPARTPQVEAALRLRIDVFKQPGGTLKTKEELALENHAKIARLGGAKPEELQGKSAEDIAAMNRKKSFEWLAKQPGSGITTDPKDPDFKKFSYEQMLQGYRKVYKLPDKASWADIMEAWKGNNPDAAKAEGLTVSASDFYKKITGISTLPKVDLNPPSTREPVIKPPSGEAETTTPPEGTELDQAEQALKEFKREKLLALLNKLDPAARTKLKADYQAKNGKSLEDAIDKELGGGGYFMGESIPFENSVPYLMLNALNKGMPGEQAKVLKKLLIGNNRALAGEMHYPASQKAVVEFIKGLGDDKALAEFATIYNTATGGSLKEDIGAWEKRYKEVQNNSNFDSVRFYPQPEQIAFFERVQRVLGR
jgi:hypothetical protein